MGDAFSVPFILSCSTLKFCISMGFQSIFSSLYVIAGPGGGGDGGGDGGDGGK